MPKVSIIMPNYNGESSIKKSIQSVLEQTYDDFELIIVDDNSIDRSKEMIESFNDERIKKHYLVKNRHVAYTVNEGFKKAKGQYIARIDSDDIWKKNKLQKQVEFMDSHDEYGACFTRVHIINNNDNICDDENRNIYNLFNKEPNKTQKEWVRYFFENGNCLCNPSSIIRRSLLDKIGINYNIAYVPAQDFELWTRLIKKAPIYILDEKLTLYRWTSSESQISGNDKSSEIAFFNVHTMIKRNYFDDMSNEEFIYFFKDAFVNQNSSSELELEIEKAYLLLNCVKTTNMKWLGFERFEKILNIPNGIELLEEKYKFDLKSYYKEYRKSSLNDVVMQRNSDDLENKNKSLNLKVEILQKQIDDLKLEVKKMNLEVTNMMSSTSWKVTSPFRKMMRIVKKISKKFCFL